MAKMGQAKMGQAKMGSQKWGQITFSSLRCFSIGSNDLTQLTPGLDRDSGLELLAKDFDERASAVKAMLEMAIKACLAQGRYVGICGQGPSDHPDFAQWLAGLGISSISLNLDTVMETQKLLAGYLEFVARCIK